MIVSYEIEIDCFILNQTDFIRLFKSDFSVKIPKHKFILHIHRGGGTRETGHLILTTFSFFNGPSRSQKPGSSHSIGFPPELCLPTPPSSLAR